MKQDKEHGLRPVRASDKTGPERKTAARFAPSRSAAWKASDASAHRRGTFRGTFRQMISSIFMDLDNRHARRRGCLERLGRRIDVKGIICYP